MTLVKEKLEIKSGLDQVKKKEVQAPPFLIPKARKSKTTATHLLFN